MRLHRVTSPRLFFIGGAVCPAGSDVGRAFFSVGLSALLHAASLIFLPRGSHPKASENLGGRRYAQ